MSALSQANNAQAVPVTQFLMWALVALLGIVLLALVVRLINKSRKGNSIYYEEKGAINIRVGKTPEIRIATRNCKDFHMRVYGKKIVLSYANPMGGKKEFTCELVGEPCKERLLLVFSEKEFRKLCLNMKPGKLAIKNNRILLNYNQSVRVREIKKIRKEVKR